MALSRREILKRIKELEQARRWHEDVEDDLETVELLPDKIDYLNEKLKNRIATAIANKKATRFFEKMLKKKQMIIKEVIGIENFLAVKGGAILTCNHFNACDNYAVWRAIKPYMGKKRLYKVIREGNYTSYPGMLGFFFRHCNTLPLSRNTETLKKFLKAIKVLLDRGEKILIYPEQSMWWNYKKPRPYKDGAFKFAVSNNVPIIPFFITMEDSDVDDVEGFKIQEYTIHILPAIYSKKDLSKQDNIVYMKTTNFNACKEVYQRVYSV